MQTSTETIDFSRVSDLLRQGCRVTLFLRHSERPPIDPADKTFGQALPLTPHGIGLACAAGKPLAGCGDARFAASPMVRCRMTASCIAQGMDLPDAPVADEPRLGLECFYYEDPENLQAAMREQGYLTFMLDYFRKGVAPYSRPLGVATQMMTAWLKDATTRQLNVLVSHDIFIAALLTGLRVRTYSADNWVGFIHGAAIIRAPSGAWRCHPCLPDISQACPVLFLH
ncbi:MAG: histidine phosphatase family protein [Kiritimatiellaeota bacterium]|nr:histidine phosphatase family protein [Kiritimatiellota bacterium]